MKYLIIILSIFVLSCEKDTSETITFEVHVENETAIIITHNDYCGLTDISVRDTVYIYTFSYSGSRNDLILTAETPEDNNALIISKIKTSGQTICENENSGFCVCSIN